MIRVELPTHLQRLAGVDREVQVDVAGAATPRAILDELEARHPVLRGLIRDHVTHERRKFVRYFACSEDVSHDDPDAPLPEPIARGTQPFVVLGAMSGG